MRAAICLLAVCLLWPEQAASARPPAQEQTRAGALVLDPGHSAGRPGATSCSGIYEYLYNDALTDTILRHLGARGIQAGVTRKPGGEISLAARARAASGKVLFLSLHHDSAQARFIRYAGGTPCSDRAEGFSLFVSAKNAFFQESLAAARVLGAALREFGLTPSRHHGENIPGENRTLLDAHCGIYRFDDLIVLKQARAPAVLLEAGVIVHPADDARVKTRAHQLKIAEAAARAFRFAAGAASPAEAQAPPANY